jgi:peptidyl-prolyl cis-trans isomerase D
LSNAKLLEALFATDSVQKKRNTEAVELGANQLAAARVVQYAPAATQPLETVASQVRARLVAERAAALAKADGEAKLAAWKAKPETAQLPAAITVSRDRSEGLPPKVLNAVLSADLAAAPAWVGLDEGQAGYVIAKVIKSVPRVAPAPEMARQEAKELAELWGGAEAMSYMAYLRTKYKAEITAPAPKTGASGS